MTVTEAGSSEVVAAAVCKLVKIKRSDGPELAVVCNSSRNVKWRFGRHLVLGVVKIPRKKSFNTNRRSSFRTAYGGGRFLVQFVVGKEFLSDAATFLVWIATAFGGTFIVRDSITRSSIGAPARLPLHDGESIVVSAGILASSE